jgi:hypothetical protein
MDFLSKNLSPKNLIIASILVLLLVQYSEQQFSYSANWGKRSGKINSNIESIINRNLQNPALMQIECRNAIRVRQLVSKIRSLKIDKNFQVNIFDLFKMYPFFSKFTQTIFFENNLFFLLVCFYLNYASQII